MRTLLILAAGCLATSPAFGQLLMDTSTITGNGRTKAAATFQASEIEYEGDNNTADVERKTLGAELSYGVTPDVDVVAQLGLIMESEIEDVDEEGDGFTFGAGVRALAYRSGKTSVTGFGMFNYQTEEFEYDVGAADVKYELDTYDFHIGGMVSHAVTPTVAPYAGIDLVAFDDGEGKSTVKVAGQSQSDDSDVERDDILNLKLGANFQVSKAQVRPEATLIGEQTFSLSAGVLF